MQLVADCVHTRASQKKPVGNILDVLFFLSTVGDLCNINKHKTQTSLSLISVLNVQVYSGIVT